MDKVEYRELIRSIKNNYLNNDYEGVIAISDQLEIDKIKENSILEIIAKAYESLGRCDLAREALLVAYKRTPTGKRIAYNLAMLSIKLDDLDNAVLFYEDFCKMAPKDNQRLILKYQIGRAGGVPVANLVHVLEKYTSREMDDRWQYELARLYHEMGDDEKCAAACDQIILWYANGEYEKKALELKNMHKALNPVQQARYEEIMHAVLETNYVDNIIEEKTVVENESEVKEETTEVKEEITAEKEPEVKTEAKEEVINDIDFDTEHLGSEGENKVKSDDENIAGQITLSSMFEAFKKQAATDDPMNKKGEERAAQILAEVNGSHDSSALKEFEDEEEEFEETKETTVVEEVIEPEVPLLNREDVIEPVDDGGEDLWERKPEFAFEMKAKEESSVEEIPEEESAEVLTEEDEITEEDDNQHRIEQSIDATQFIPAAEIASRLAALQAEEEIDVAEMIKETPEVTVDDEEEEQEPVAKPKKKAKPSFFARFSRPKKVPEPDPEEDEWFDEEAEEETEEVVESAEIEDEEVVTETEEETEEVSVKSRLLGFFRRGKKSIEEAEEYEIEAGYDDEAMDDELVNFISSELDDEDDQESQSVIDEVPEAEEVSVEASEDTAEEVLEEVAEDTAEEVLEEVAEDTAEEVLEEVAEDTAEEVSEEVVEDTAEEVISEEVEETEKVPTPEEIAQAEKSKAIIEDIIARIKESSEKTAETENTETEIAETENQEHSEETSEDLSVSAEAPVDQEPEIVAEEDLNEDVSTEEEIAEEIEETAEPDAVEKLVKTSWFARTFGKNKKEKPVKEPVIVEKELPIIEEPEEEEPVIKEKTRPKSRQPEGEKPVKVKKEKVKKEKIKKEKPKKEKPEKKEPVELEVPVAETKQEAPKDIESLVEGAKPVIAATAATGAAFTLNDFINPNKKVEPDKEIAEKTVIPEFFNKKQKNVDFNLDSFIDPSKTPERKKAPSRVETPKIEVDKDKGEFDLEAFIKSDKEVKPVKAERKQFSFDELFSGKLKAHQKEAKQEAKKALNPVKKLPLYKKYELSKQQRKNLAEFLLIDGMEDAICTTIEKLVIKKKSGDETGGHLIVTGDAKTGKTYLAIEIIKAVNQEVGYGNQRIAKVQAQAINGKNIKKVLAKVTDSDLIIENIGKLEDDTIVDLISAVRESNAPTMVILEGNQLAADTMIQNFPDIGKIFKTRVNIGELTLTQWADIAQKYAKGQGFSISDMAQLALHAKIDEINTPDIRLGFSQVRQVVDDAIDKAEKRNAGKLFSAFSKKTEDDLVPLEENDFM